MQTSFKQHLRQNRRVKRVGSAKRRHAKRKRDGLGQRAHEFDKVRNPGRLGRLHLSALGYAPVKPQIMIKYEL